MASNKPGMVDYLTLLGYVTQLHVKVYSLNHIDCKFTDTDLLGSGSSMNVYQGNLIEDPRNPNCERIPVAIKIPKINIKEMSRDSKAFRVLADVRQELRMMKHFESHANIINLYGVVFQDLKPLVIVELAEDCVPDYLGNKKEEGNPIDWETKARYCCEVADGLRALHVAKIIHGDLKGDNILLFKDSKDKDRLIAKITDFGYSLTSASIERGSSTGGTLFFLAPECTNYAPTEMKEYQNKPFKDIYSFGLFVWQVAKDGEVPYDELEEEEIQKIKNTDKNLDELMNLLDEDTPRYFKDVILSMTKYTPEERGDLARIREMMELDSMDDADFAAIKTNLEMYAKELPRDVVKADLSSIELMSIPISLKTKIYREYEKTAGNGDANAMFMMAICHSKGFAVEVDNQKGLEWCVKAANAGSVDAMINIAENYDIKSVPVEPEVAFPWYLKAAEEGYRNAIDQVINCYGNGVGVKRSFIKKGYWRTVLKISPSTSAMSENIGETSLHRAARLGNLEAARPLLEQQKVDIDTKNNEGETALHIAAQCGHTEIVSLLVTTFGADTTVKNNFGRTPLQLAALKGHVKIVRLLENEATIKKLDFSRINLSLEEIRLLMESLKEFPVLTDLDLQGNKFGKEGFKALMGYLTQNTTLAQLNLGSIEISEEGVYALGKYLERNSNLAHLSLQETKIGDNGACTLAKFLENNSTLTDLNLASNGIASDGLCALAEYLGQNPSLIQLVLDSNHIGYNETWTLAECLENNTTLTQLRLQHNRIGNEGATALAECLQENSALTELYLGNNHIYDEGAFSLAEFLKQNSTIKYLGLNGNRIGEEGVSALGEGLAQNSTLTQLELGSNNFGDEGACSLVEHMKQNSALTHLYIGSNSIGHRGGCAIAEYLKQNSALTHLNLGEKLAHLSHQRNVISVQGGCAIAECLKQNSTLTHLDLDGNKIRDEGVCALAECLKQNSTITELCLGYNSIYDKGACALAECLKHNSTITYLGLNNNYIGKEGACALAESLKQNSSLTRLILQFNEIGDEGARAFGECLEQNSTLTQLMVYRNKLSDETKAHLQKSKIFVFGHM